MQSSGKVESLRKAEILVSTKTLDVFLVQQNHKIYAGGLKNRCSGRFGFHLGSSILNFATLFPD